MEDIRALFEEEFNNAGDGKKEKNISHVSLTNGTTA
jgi:hypothetical protein